MLPEVTREFLIESHEGLDRLDRDLVGLEQDPRNPETLGSVFRTIHTIKGTCGFLGYTKLESISHLGENLLSRLRDGHIRLTADLTTGLLGMVDAIREILAAIERTGREGDGDYSAIIASLEALHASNAGMAPRETPGSGSPPRAGADARESVRHSSLRVDVGLVDSLMNLVGELVLARNQLLRHTAAEADGRLLSAAEQLKLVTSELHEGIMKTRLQPIGIVWSKFPRLARDLALQCGKQVRLEMEGGATELDKTMIEAVKDPLTHLIRNAVDHGIEPPDVRVALGKPAAGTIRLRALHEGGRIRIEIADDGGGVSPDRVRTRAVERGLITREQASRLSDHDAVSLIFLPGFSTAERITTISGRGVGLDVVKTNIDRIGGAVEVQSTPGAGTAIRIAMPLTLAIVPALMVTSGGQPFAIPQVSLLELVRLDDQGRLGLERAGEALCYRLRGTLLPVTPLAQQLGLDAAGDADAVHIAVVQSEGRPWGLVVDTIGDTEEIVVKPLGPGLTVPVFAGATVLSDGRVALVLDVPALAERAGIVSGPLEPPRANVQGATASAGPAADGLTLLIVEVSGHDRLAIPLSAVARVEEFPVERIERAGERDLVRDGEDVLDLLNLPEDFGHPRPTGERRQVVVCADRGRRVGLVVGRILDIVSDQVAVDHRSRRRGVLGSAVVGEQVMDLLDVRAVTEGWDPVIVGSPRDAAERPGGVG